MCQKENNRHLNAKYCSLRCVRKAGVLLERSRKMYIKELLWETRPAYFKIEPRVIVDEHGNRLV